MTTSDAVLGKKDFIFVNRVKYFVIKAAIAVAFEATTVPLHADRLDLSARILGDEDEYAQRFALGVMTNSSLLAASSFASISDSDLEFVVNSIFNAYI